MDPLATGLLLICTGKKTKEIGYYQGQKKGYTGTLILGSSTPSFDLETEIDRSFSTNHITESLINKTTQNFIGEIKQYPPIFSAIKKDGKRLYQYARSGKEVDIKSRQISVDEFKITNIRGLEIDFKIQCSKGTYIRSLVNDFGKALNSGAHLSSLRRINIGRYSVNDAIKIKDFTEIYEKSGNIKIYKE